MSKKHKKQNNGQENLSTGFASHAVEYKIIKHDLIKVLLLNALYLVAVLGLYFSNQKTQYLQAWFVKMFHF